MGSVHILNGDALAEKLLGTAINKDLIVCRECLIEGTVTAENLNDFYTSRARFLHEAYQVTEEEYFKTSVGEFDKISNLPPGSEVCLWFEDDLFCQANMWFTLSLLKPLTFLRIYRVFPVLPEKADHWVGFGFSTPELLNEAYFQRTQMTSEDIELADNLWSAYKANDFMKLKDLSAQPSTAFHYLKEVCQAHIDRFPSDGSAGRPERTALEIVHTVSRDFNQVFSEFSKREGIYGFGDLQFKKIYDRVLTNLS